MTRYVLQIHCPDQTGLIAGTTQVLAKAGANIVDLTQHSAKDIGIFFLRAVFEIEENKIEEDSIANKIENESLKEEVKNKIDTLLKSYAELVVKEDGAVETGDVAVIDFRINYFDNMIGAEAFGLYEIMDRAFIERLAKNNFERRKEIYLLEGNYDYDEDDENDMLNCFDIMNTFAEECDSYHTYVQYVDAGVYIIVAKGLEIVR